MYLNFNDSSPPSYEGYCNICGFTGVFHKGNSPSIRESYPCPSCKGTVRYRDQAAIILDEFSNGKFCNLKDRSEERRVGKESR